MRLKAKFTRLLAIGFSVLFILMSVIFLLALKRSQQENMQAFRNEFAEASIELLDNNAALFFEFFSSQVENGRFADQAGAISYLGSHARGSRNVVAFDLEKMSVLPGLECGTVNLVCQQEVVDGAFENWILRGGKSFEFDNFDRFIGGDGETVPTKIYFKVYDKLGLMLAYGKSFHAGKVRLQYLEERNIRLYQAGLFFTVTASMLALILIASMLFVYVKRIFLSPLSRLHDGILLHQSGNSGPEAVAIMDELAELSEFINETVTDLNRFRYERKRQQHSRKMSAIGQMTSGVAHDFGNMLNAIRMSAQVLKARVGDDPVNNRCLDLIIGPSDHASALIQRLLDFGRMEASMAWFDVHACIDDVMVLLASVVRKDIEMSVMKSARSSIVYGDQSQLLNALVNMGINASHAMPDGGVLKISTRNIMHDEAFCRNSGFDLSPGEYIRLEVMDSGCGIPEQDMKKIFEPFFTTKQETGNGLGLAMVYDMILEHRGAILVSSKLGEGSTFQVDLPMFRCDNQETEGKEARHPSVA